MKRTFTSLATTLTLFACGGAAEETTSQNEERQGEHHAGGEHHGGGGDHPDMPPAVDGFHSVLGPIWHAEPGSTRQGLACDPDNHRALEGAADDVEAMAVPAGVDATEWNAAADALAASVDGVAGACEAGGDEAEARLSDVHDAFHRVAELASQRHEPAAEGEAPPTEMEAAE